MCEKLKPCPLCGGIPSIAGIVTRDSLVWRLWLANGEYEDFPTRDAAHEAWNRRVNDEESSR